MALPGYVLDRMKQCPIELSTCLRIWVGQSTTELLGQLSEQARPTVRPGAGADDRRPELPKLSGQADE